MLSLFPRFLSYGMLGVFLVRTAVAMVLLYVGLMTNSVNRSLYEVKMRVNNFKLPRFIPAVFGTIEIITGLFLLAGFLTQLMAIISIYIFVNLFFIERYVARIFDFRNIYYLLIIMVSLSLLFLGPGSFSVDLPL